MKRKFVCGLALMMSVSMMFAACGSAAEQAETTTE